MKKLSLIIFLCFVKIQAFSQDSHKINISNVVLEAKLRVYAAGIKQWANKNEIPDYVICMFCEADKNYSKFTLTTIYRKQYLYQYNFSSYTLIDNFPILIQQLTDKFVKADTVFINDFLVKNKINKIFDFEQYKQGRINELKKNPEFKSDSVNLPTPQGYKKVATKDMKPTFTEPPLIGKGIEKLYNLELLFFNEILVDEKRYSIF